jgi:hypothetical protein
MIDEVVGSGEPKTRRRKGRNSKKATDNAETPGTQGVGSPQHQNIVGDGLRTETTLDVDMDAAGASVVEFDVMDSGQDQ